MSLPEEAFKSHPVAMLGLGVAILAFPFAFPSLRRQWAAAAKEGVKLFFEAQSDVEGELIETLADDTIDQIAGALSKPPHQREAKIASIASAFQRKARRRANRWGRNQEDRDEHYRRHVAALGRRLARRSATAHYANALQLN